MKKLILIIFLISSCFIASCGTTEPDNKKETSKNSLDEKQYENIAETNNQLGFQLLSILNKNNKDNIFISPFSAFMAISLVYNGADGETKDEIQKVLQSDLNVEKLNEQHKKLLESLNYDDGGMQLKIANSIWLNEQFHFQDQFANNMKKYYKADTEEVNVTSPEAPKKINDWVKEQTKGKIDNIVEHPLNNDLVSMFINAIYFKGQWMNEFDSKITENRTFYLADQSKKELPFMQQKNKWLYLENEKFQAISLPYKDEKMTMKVILPKEQTDMDDFIQNMTIENWKKWKNEFSLKEGTVLLPKFQLKYEVDLNNSLQQLGMKNAFERNANFSKLIKEEVPLWIDKVKQVAYIDVNEEGTEAAAVTSIAIETTAFMEDETFYMEVNRPFFIAIVDEKKDLILFMGLIENP